MHCAVNVTEEEENVGWVSKGRILIRTQENINFFILVKCFHGSSLMGNETQQFGQFGHFSTMKIPKTLLYSNQKIVY